LTALGLYLATHWGWVSATSTYGHPLLPLLIAASGFSSVINGCSSTLAATAIRSFKLRPVFLLDFVGQITGLIVTVALATWTRSIWSLVIGNLAAIGLSAVLSHVWMQGPRNRIQWDASAAKELLSYGKWLMMSSSITVFANNGDRLMLAAYANAYFLGLYSVALSLVGALDTVLTQFFDKVMLPAFSEVARNNPEGVAQAYFKLRWRIDPLILVSSGLMFGGAQLLIDVLYDHRYADAGQMLKVLSIGMVISRYRLVQQVYLAIGKTRYFVPLNVVRLVATYTLIPLGYYLNNFMGALVAITLRDLPSTLLAFYFNRQHGLNNLRLELSTLWFWPAGYLVAKGVVWAFMALH
jgi:O-antigen/teichoic acid export membrane protein